MQYAECGCFWTVFSLTSYRLVSMLRVTLQPHLQGGGHCVVTVGINPPAPRPRYQCRMSSTPRWNSCRADGDRQCPRRCRQTTYHIRRKAVCTNHGSHSVPILFRFYLFIVPRNRCHTLQVDRVWGGSVGCGRKVSNRGW